MDTGTTARFMVNGERSDVVPIRSGIRQGYPLAPLLFLIVVELLGLAIHQAPGIRGIPVPGAGGVGHTFSEFVDDSTLFLEQSYQLASALQQVNRFGQLSSLHAQTAKSRLIFSTRRCDWGSLRVSPFHNMVRRRGIWATRWEPGNY